MNGITRSQPCCLGQSCAVAQSCELNQILNSQPQPVLCFKAKLRYPKQPKIKAPRPPKIKTRGCVPPSAIGLGCPQPAPVPVPMPIPQSPCGGGFGGFGGGFGGPALGGFGGFGGFGGGYPAPSGPLGPIGPFPGAPGPFGPFSNGQVPLQQHTLAFTQRQLRRIQKKSARGKVPKACAQGCGGGAGGLF